MQALTPYLAFNGTCREAMEFYKSILGGNLEMMTFENSPPEMPVADKTKIMHATLTVDSLVLMASDSPSHPIEMGNSVSLSFNCNTLEEINSLYARFAVGGKETMPLQDTFWGARFGILTDKFGIHWMLSLIHI